jgi:ABC-type phosphate/phosphonate transport system substrate-binding protein
MSVRKKGLLGAGLIALTGLFVSTFVGMQATIAKPTASQKTSTLLAQNQKSLTIIFPSRSDSTDLQNKANAVAAFLSKELGMPVQAQVGDDTAAVEALRANRADVAFLSSRPALKAEQLANARLYLAEVRQLTLADTLITQYSWLPKIALCKLEVQPKQLSNNCGAKEWLLPRQLLAVGLFSQSVNW